MEDIDKIFRTSLKHFSDQHGSERQFALKMDLVSVDYMNKLLSGKRKGDESLRRNLAEKLGFPNRRYEDFLDIGRAILEGTEPKQTEPPEFSPEQQAAIEAFKTCLKIGGDIPNMLARTAIEHVKQKQIEAEYQNPTPRRLSKSA